VRFLGTKGHGMASETVMSVRYPTAIVWLRRDLRLDDHVALFEAARASTRLVCAFVLDPPLLRGPRVGAPIVQFFFDSLRALRATLRDAGSDLVLLEGDFGAELIALARSVDAQAVYYNLDYDPDAAARDARVTQQLRAAGLAVHAFTDHVYFGADEVLQPTGKPYTVFTPYRRRWGMRRDGDARPPLASAALAGPKLAPAASLPAPREVPQPEDFGHRSNPEYPRGGSGEAHALLERFLTDAATRYKERRNQPASEGTSRLSPHLRAGTIGIRTLIDAAERLRDASTPQAAAEVGTWISELIWREFYQQLLANVPRVAHEPFIHAANGIAYANDPALFAAWCEGRTGYPIVDAAMLQLNTTGWMHNRLRMIVASFLTKHLLCDYRDGERYFEQHLADADLAANNGGWQWSASTGVDAAPYFRVFNPTLQGATFDPEGAFVRAMLPVLARVPDAYVHQPWTMPPLLQLETGCVVGRDYPEPIVDHAFARQRALEVFGAALGRNARLSSP
jgi:deoxyribodipyrimidine photo-lyase